MQQIDYKLLKALFVVINQQSFERAASLLNISQSAISQRIKMLEQWLGHPVLIRSKPLRLTEIGRQLVIHYQQVEALQRELLPQILPESPVLPTKLSFAVNADSLATWFLDAVAPLIKLHPVELDLLVCDEQRTLEKLKSGEAFAAVSLSADPLPGYKVQYLGQVNYILVASPEFKERFFAKGVNISALTKAHGIAFDQQDDMHHRFIEQHFSLKPGDYPCHVVRSSEAFVDMAKKGLAYCLLPEIQIKQELCDKQLVSIFAASPLVEKLYWHSWIMGKGLFKQASELIVKHARSILDHA